MRHAKSDWNDLKLADKARPLNQRGRIAAPIMAQWIFENDLMPDIVLCSSAVRTQQTLELMVQYWFALPNVSSIIHQPEILIEDNLYLASESTILAVAKSAPNLESKQRLLVLGHNPGMENLASIMSQCVIEMPTGAIAVLDSNSQESVWPVDWSSSKLWNWRCLVKPREIDGNAI